MNVKKYNKLVRDRIPEIIEKEGKEVSAVTAGGKEKSFRLDQKLKEEAEEFLESHSMEEMADILEVLHAQASLLKMDWQDIEKVRLEKKEKRGGFEQGIVLLEVWEIE